MLTGVVHSSSGERKAALKSIEKPKTGFKSAQVKKSGNIKTNKTLDTKSLSKAQETADLFEEAKAEVERVSASPVSYYSETNYTQDKKLNSQLNKYYNEQKASALVDTAVTNAINNPSNYRCTRGVSYAIRDTFAKPGQSGVPAYTANDFGSALMNSYGDTFKKLDIDFTNNPELINQLPPGCVVTFSGYNGGAYSECGHVLITTKDGAVSDHIEHKPNGEYFTSRGSQVQAYIPC